jgi:hypothetical protein
MLILVVSLLVLLLGGGASRGPFAEFEIIKGCGGHL